MREPLAGDMVVSSHEGAAQAGDRELLVARYSTTSAVGMARQKVEAIAHECGVGSWSTLPFEEEAEHLTACVCGLGQPHRVRHSGVQSDSCRERFSFWLGFPCEVLGDSLGELLEFTMGGVSGLADLCLEELRIPPALWRTLTMGLSPGREVRQRLAEADRPLLQCIIKPCFGIDLRQVTGLAEAAAKAGADMLKDDELAAHGDICSQVRRVEAIRDSLERATPPCRSRPLYFAQLSGLPERAVERAIELLRRGADGLLISPYAMGFDVQGMIVRETGAVVQSHPSCSGMWYMGSGAKLAGQLVFGLLPRLAGASVAMLFVPEGKFGLAWDEADEAVQEITAARGDADSPVPSFAGGLLPSMVSGLVERYGRSLVCSAGGSVFGHPLGPEAGVVAFLDAIQAACSGSKPRSKEYLEASSAWRFSNADSFFVVRA